MDKNASILFLKIEKLNLLCFATSSFTAPIFHSPPSHQLIRFARQPVTFNFKQIFAQNILPFLLWVICVIGWYQWISVIRVLWITLRHIRSTYDGPPLLYCHQPWFFWIFISYASSSTLRPCQSLADWVRISDQRRFEACELAHSAFWRSVTSTSITAIERNSMQITQRCDGLTV